MLNLGGVLMIGSWIKCWLSFPSFIHIPHGVKKWISWLGIWIGKAILILDPSTMLFILWRRCDFLGRVFGEWRPLRGLPFLCGPQLGVGFFFFFLSVNKSFIAYKKLTIHRECTNQENYNTIQAIQRSKKSNTEEKDIMPKALDQSTEPSPWSPANSSPPPQNF